MTIKEIVREYLEGHGYDGLVNPGVECGCDSEDLNPCDAFDDDCVPGYRWTCPDANSGCRAFDDVEGCEWFPDGCFRTEKQGAEVMR